MRERATRSTRELGAAGIEVLFDDRDERPGVKFADAELLGIPHRRGIGARPRRGKLEYRHRRAESSEELPGEQALEFVRGRLAAG